ncbi:purine-nucleoside phosphorylase [Candidatus Izimaplasma bacterium ZiA1]|uniref:purine-nucleoside phosphorylase n=1 Tax=Candidatus Izimoplasma sp. ZiA1 TaxID=2024899 RepID=UPI000BAA8444|nr:purine-nucleoside phosphorylase [Candidatus Izimaplasma bacterium ZiA1]
MYDKANESMRFIRNSSSYEPKTAIVLGSGLSSIIDEIIDPVEIMYEDIPHFKTSTVKGHVSKLVIGTLNGVEVLLMSGRFHFYEGYSMKELTFPIFVFKLLGIENLILTNSCGGINETLVKPGEIMVINDFINLMPSNPLIGLNDERFGPRFPDMTEPYSLTLRAIAKKAAEDINVKYCEGVYAGFMGPYYETKAEIRMIKNMGADAVGMSTVPETIISNYLGINTLAFATITNMATGIQKVKHSHDNVVKMANIASENLANWIKKIIVEIG